MIRIFDAKPVPASVLKGVTAFALNIAVAIVSTALAFVYFAVGFAAGESPQPVPTSVIVFLCTDVALVAAMGFWCGWRLRRFPWPGVALTALLVAELFWFLGDKDGSGLLFGVEASTVLLLGALMARGLRQVKARLNAR